MNQRTLVPSLFFILLASSTLTAQQTPDSTNDRLATILHLPVLTSHDWQVLFSEAESGNPEAQYWLGRIYDAGRLLPKDAEKSLHWYKESAEQNYAPAEYFLCLMHINREEVESERSMWRAAETVSPMSRISGLESQISRRHLSGSNKLLNAARSMPKPHWVDAMRMAMA